MHEEVACTVEVFAAAFKSNFTEGETKTYRLPDTTEEAFRLLMQYLYCPCCFSMYQVSDAWKGWAKNNRTIAASWVSKENENIVRMWVLADMLCMPELCDLALKDLDDGMKQSEDYPLDLMRLVFELTSKGSALRDHAFEFCRSSMTPDGLREFTDAFPVEIQQELLAYIIKYNHENPGKKPDDEPDRDTSPVPWSDDGN